MLDAASIPVTAPEGSSPWLIVILALIGLAGTVVPIVLTRKGSAAQPGPEALATGGASPAPTEADPELALIRQMIEGLTKRLEKSEAKVEELTEELARERAVASELRRMLDVWTGRQHPGR